MNEDTSSKLLECISEDTLSEILDEINLVLFSKTPMSRDEYDALVHCGDYLSKIYWVLKGVET